MKRIRTFLVLLIISSLVAACDPTTRDGTPIPGENTNDTNKTTGSDSGRWIVPGPADPQAPRLIVTSGEKTSRLDPAWELAKISYSDDWWGLGKPGSNNQTITLEGGAYFGDKLISAEDVRALVQSLDNLYPAQMLMQGNAWTDDYPSWSVELVGTDGQVIMLFASSTGNPGNGPWNLLYNGHLYAQYSGEVAKLLGKLFGGRLGKDDNPFPNSGPEGQVSFSTTSLPTQLIYGFWGLLPISNDFSYTADAARGEISGRIVGSSRIGSMEIGQIKDLRELRMTANGSDITCEIEVLPEGDPWTATTAWGFTCPLGSVKAGDPYSYPLHAVLATDKGETVEVDGELWGTWTADAGPRYTLLPPAPDIADALATHPQARELLSDHILGAATYSANLPADNPMNGERGGEAILFGHTIVGSMMVRYTVGAQFAIDDGKVTYWDLDRSGLNAMLKEITAYPLTHRVVAANPRAVINMWYASGAPTRVRAGLDFGVQPYSVQVNACGTVPGGAFPSAGKPLMAFNYDAGLFFPYNAPFVVIDGKPVVSEITIYPGDEDPARKALVPPALDTGNSKPFDSIFMETAPYSGGGPTLRIRTPEKVEPGERHVHEALLDALPVAPESGDGQMIVRGVTLAVDAEGKLQVSPCAQANPTPQGSNPATTFPPHIVYSTYYGSLKGNIEWITNFGDMAVDREGYAYAVVSTNADDIPLKNPMKGSASGEDRTVVAKFNQDGSDLVYATTLPLEAWDTGVEAIAVGRDGALYMTGATYDGSLPQRTIFQKNGNDADDSGDAYLSKLSPDGTRIEYSVVLGGGGYDEGYKVAVDDQGNAYMIGETRSADFPTTNALWPKFNGPKESGAEAFIAKISPDGKQVLYSTFLGGAGADGVYGATIDASGDLYLTGYTDSTDFPLAGPAQSKPGGLGDAFLMKLKSDGSGLIFSTLLGGSSGDVGVDTAFDAQGNVYLTGNTSSPDFPLKNPLFTTFNGGVSFSADEDSVRDAFIAKFNPQGSALLFSTLLGGSVDDRGRGIGLDDKGNIYVGGSTTSLNFPLVAPFQDKYAGGDIGLAPDSFLVKLDPSATTIVYSTYFGGQDFDDLRSFAVDKAGNVYFAGSAEAPTDDFPISDNAFMKENPGRRSIYITKITDDNP